MEPQTVRILVVDDIPENVRLLVRILSQIGFQVQTATSGRQAFELISITAPDIILLDISMPGMSGFEVCERLKANPLTSDIPVLFITAHDDRQNKVRAFEAGGVDFIIKPFEDEDVLARVQAHLRLLEQRRQIEALSALKDQLMRTVSHDLKNPLGVVMAYASLITQLDPSKDGERMQQNAQRIHKSAEKMLALVRDFLDLANIEQGLALQKVALPAADFLGDLLSDFEIPAQNKNILLELAVPPELVLYVDKNRFAQVVNNLLSNAIKYTLEGGCVTLSAERQGADMLVQVSDTGLGIPPEAMSRLFEQFYRVRTFEHLAVEGTGIGLSIVKALVQQHGGEIGVESEHGKGSTFWVRLPGHS